MPIFEFLCSSCGNITEKLILSDSEEVLCGRCGGTELTKLLSKTSSLSEGNRLPGPGDTGCCGSAPSSRGCIPGSCCGKAGH